MLEEFTPYFYKRASRFHGAQPSRLPFRPAVGAYLERRSRSSTCLQHQHISREKSQHANIVFVIKPVPASLQKKKKTVRNSCNPKNCPIYFLITKCFYIYYRTKIQIYIHRLGSSLMSIIFLFLSQTFYIHVPGLKCEQNQEI